MTLHVTVTLPPAASSAAMGEKRPRMPRAGGNGRDEAHAIQPVVDRHAQPAHVIAFLVSTLTNDKRQKPVRDRALERRLRRRAGGIDVNPLPVVGRLGELIDPFLGHLIQSPTASS